RVAPAAATLALGQRLQGLVAARQLLALLVRREAAPGARRLCLSHRHELLRYRSALEELDAIAGGELDDRLLPRPGRTPMQAAALGLRANLDRPHLDHAHVEDLLDREPDLG